MILVDLSHLIIELIVREAGGRLPVQILVAIVLQFLLSQLFSSIPAGAFPDALFAREIHLLLNLVERQVRSADLRLVEPGQTRRSCWQRFLRRLLSDHGQSLLNLIFRASDLSQPGDGTVSVAGPEGDGRHVDGGHPVIRLQSDGLLQVVLCFRQPPLLEQRISQIRQQIRIVRCAAECLQIVIFGVVEVPGLIADAAEHVMRGDAGRINSQRGFVFNLRQFELAVAECPVAFGQKILQPLLIRCVERAGGRLRLRDGGWLCSRQILWAARWFRDRGLNRRLIFPEGIQAG